MIRAITVRTHRAWHVIVATWHPASMETLITPALRHGTLPEPGGPTHVLGPSGWLRTT